MSKWYATLLERALAETDDIAVALAAAEIAYEECPEEPKPPEQPDASSPSVPIPRWEERRAGKRVQARGSLETSPPVVDDSITNTEVASGSVDFSEKSKDRHKTRGRRSSRRSKRTSKKGQRKNKPKKIALAIEERFGSEAPGAGWRYDGNMRWLRDLPENPMPPQTQSTGPKIAIVGGGPAGLFTAYIMNQRFPDARLTIFEATECLGGKIHTDRFDDGTLFEAGVAELYEYLGPGGKDALRVLIEEDLGLPTVNMKGGGVILKDKITRSLDEVKTAFSNETHKKIKKFHTKVAELMPLEKYARRWQPDNEHPWADKTFCDCIREEIGTDDVAIDYIETAVHSDLATESHTCNGLNGIKNVLMDNDEYMQLYHVRGGFSQIVEQLLKKIKAEYYLTSPVVKIETRDHSFIVHSLRVGESVKHEFEAVIVAIPNHWLTQIAFPNKKLAKVIHDVISHYDLPAHYLRVSLLFDEPFWNKHEIPGDFWMMDLYNGCCCYNESYRWASTRGHVLSFLLAGQDALLQTSFNQSADCIVDRLLDLLPDMLRDDAKEHFQDAQVDCYVGSINAQPGGWPAEDLRGEHHPEPKENPGFFLVGDYFFDSTLNACLISAHTAVEFVLDHFGVKAAKATHAIDLLESAGAALSATT